MTKTKHLAVNRTVFVLGTDHCYQRRDVHFTEAQHVAFAQFVIEICRTRQIEVVGEEFSIDALAEAQIAQTVPYAIARSLNLVHRYCDPDLATRAKLGIQKEGDIRVNAHFNRWAESVIQQKLQASHRARETLWLQQIFELDVWPLLFVCGADHVMSFLTLLREQNIQVELVASDWAA